MACFHPLHGFKSKRVNPTGKRSIVFNRSDGLEDLPVTVPCGQCIGCRLERSRQWAMRCVHESRQHEDNCFITLTYDDEHLPHGHTLMVEHWQKFMKRLRHHLKVPLKFFHCGEYGSEGRPHYHACIFGMDFPDRELFTEREGIKIYTSECLSDVWGKGFCTVGDVTFDSAAYVARYIMKKVTGELAEEHYEHINFETGEITQRKPEYTTMSNGIGMSWMETYKTEVLHNDSVIFNGHPVRPPTAYQALLSETELLQLKSRRKQQATKYADNNTTERLWTREKVKRAQAGMLKRTVK